MQIFCSLTPVTSQRAECGAKKPTFDKETELKNKPFGTHIAPHIYSRPVHTQTSMCRIFKLYMKLCLAFYITNIILKVMLINNIINDTRLIN